MINWVKLSQIFENFETQFSTSLCIDVTRSGLLLVGFNRVRENRKRKSSRSLHYHVHKNLMEVRTGILDKDFERIGKYAEYDSLSMHATMMTTRPSLVYWAGGIVEVIHLVKNWGRGSSSLPFNRCRGPIYKCLPCPNMKTKLKRESKRFHR